MTRDKLNMSTIAKEDQLLSFVTEEWSFTNIENMKRTVYYQQLYEEVNNESHVDANLHTVGFITSRNKEISNRKVEFVKVPLKLLSVPILPDRCNPKSSCNEAVIVIGTGKQILKLYCNLYKNVIVSKRDIPKVTIRAPLFSLRAKIWYIFVFNYDLVLRLWSDCGFPVITNTDNYSVQVESLVAEALSDIEISWIMAPGEWPKQLRILTHNCLVDTHEGNTYILYNNKKSGKVRNNEKENLKAHEEIQRCALNMR